MHELPLKDKDGNQIFDEDVLFGENTYWSIWKTESGAIDMFSCTVGYKHSITQETIKDFKRMGDLESNKHLLECD
jgi:hypothetical protein